MALSPLGTTRGERSVHAGLNLVERRSRRQELVVLYFLFGISPLANLRLSYQNDNHDDDDGDNNRDDDGVDETAKMFSPCDVFTSL